MGVMLESPFSQAELHELGQFATAVVVRRTKIGVDPDRLIFKPYSYAYAIQRLSKGYASHPVDLARTGHMLAGIIPIVEKDEVRVTFLSAVEAEKARRHHAGASGRAVVNEYIRTTGKTVTGKGKKRNTEYQLGVVHGHTRKVNLPRREFMDIRHPSELEACADILERQYSVRIQKFIARNK